MARELRGRLRRLIGFNIQDMTNAAGCSDGVFVYAREIGMACLLHRRDSR
jgi:hypothetical protein